jgi:hypothetical protein
MKTNMRNFFKTLGVGWGVSDSLAYTGSKTFACILKGLVFQVSFKGNPIRSLMV